jgi:hypothetical protein
MMSCGQSCFIYTPKNDKPWHLPGLGVLLWVYLIRHLLKQDIGDLNRTCTAPLASIPSASKRNQ